MKIAILQTDIDWGNPSVNVKKADEMIDRYEQVDLFVLPEMFSTGFCTDPKGIAEPLGGESLQWMKRKAKEKGCALAGSIATEENGRFFNRFYFVHPDGKVDSYDKKHLFTYGHEDRFFTAGDQRVIVRYKGVSILLQVCYDLRFPVWARNRKEYDLILYVASWPASRIEAWNTLLRARAIENQCYVAGVNRVGEDPNCTYSGGSAVIDPFGHTLACCGDATPNIAVADLDLESLEAFRKKFPVLNDADSFNLD